MDPFSVVKIGHVLITLGGGLAVLALPFGREEGAPPAPLTARHLLGVCAWLSVEFFIASIFHRAIGLSGFGLIYLLYLDLFVTLPLLALGLTIRHFAFGRKLTGPAIALSLPTLCSPAFAYYATWVEPFDLRLEEQTVQMGAGRGAGAPIRVGVIADLQAQTVTDHERRAISLVMERQPDIILIPGDIIHWSDTDKYIEAIPEFRDLLSELHAPGGVFFVQGNTDEPALEQFLFEGTDIVVLRDEMTTIEVNGNQVTLAGLALAHHNNPVGRSTMSALESNDGDTDIRILLSHMPDPVLYLHEDSRVDLVVAGHTHGGQVQIPLFGPPLTLSDVPNHVAAGGLSEYHNNQIYVSRGIGVERAQAPRVRFFSPPEVSILTIVPGPPAD